VKALWFLNGMHFSAGPGAAANRAVLRRLARHGQVFGKHGCHHSRMLRLAAKEMAMEIGECSRQIGAATGQAVNCFRAPFAQANDLMRTWLRSHEPQRVGWDANSLDAAFRRPHSGISKRIVDHLTGADGGSPMADGDNILMHDRPTTAAVLKVAIDDLKRRGFTLVVPTAATDNLPHSAR
jgi:peptidoglycan/xylan/chitin deacetylase (PgdA/CDA1 family)